MGLTTDVCAWSNMTRLPYLKSSWIKLILSLYKSSPGECSKSTYNIRHYPDFFTIPITSVYYGTK